MAENLPCAEPGDSDLEIDIDGTTITAVVLCGQDLYLKLEGGFGSITGDDGESLDVQPGEPDSWITSVDMVFGFPSIEFDADDMRLMTSVVTVLEGWRSKETPVRVCAAPGKLTTIIEDYDIWVPLPSISSLGSGTADHPRSWAPNPRS